MRRFLHRRPREDRPDWRPRLRRTVGVVPLHVRPSTFYGAFGAGTLLFAGVLTILGVALGPHPLEVWPIVRDVLLMIAGVLYAATGLHIIYTWPWWWLRNKEGLAFPALLYRAFWCTRGLHSWPPPPDLDEAVKAAHSRDTAFTHTETFAVTCRACGHIEMANALYTAIRMDGGDAGGIS